MASDKLQKILAMSKNIDKKGAKVNSMPQRQIKTPISMGEQISRANKVVDDIDAMYNAPYTPTKDEIEKWNPERGRNELEEMSNRENFLKKVKKSKLPSAILESIVQNPCNLDMDTANKLMGEGDPLFKKLEEAYGKSKEEPVRGTKALQQINEQLDKRDKEKQNTSELLFPETKELEEAKDFNLSMLEEMIERVIDRKLNSLNESVSRRVSNPIKSMSLTESGNFRFLDSEDNVYECQMKYLGKRKKKK